MSGPPTPQPAVIALEDVGPAFETLKPAAQKAITTPLDKQGRKVLRALAKALAGVAQFNRTVRNGLRAAVESLPDGQVIPLTADAGEGAQALTREELLAFFDTLEWVEKTQWGREEQDRLAKAVGAEAF